VVDAIGRDAHLACYEQQQGFPPIPATLSVAAGVLPELDFDAL